MAEAFGTLLDLEPTARAPWLDERGLDPDDRRKLERLLAIDADASDNLLDRPAAEHAASLEPEPSPDVQARDLLGQQFGAFRLLELLGQGGMAVVFLGERIGADFDQRVAVKVLRRGLFSAAEQQMFRRERRLLAQLDHPHVARLIDGGVTEQGIPYLVMEYVDGARLDEHARVHRLDLRARLRLFVLACRGVEAAHRALIVHRDIKPSNILVNAEGVPKLLDFGIAKLLAEDEDATRTYGGALTPGYAAPEQFEGRPVTAATDIYALGVVLHELLTGQRPERSETVKASTTVRQCDACLGTPAELQRALRGDLDNIVARSLASDPARRYASVTALVDDVENYLEGRPVKAHPPSRWYLWRKFEQRHRVAVWLSTALLVAVLAALGTALWQGHAARVQAQRATSVRDLLVSIFRTAEVERPRDERATPEDVVNAGVDAVSRNDALSDPVRAELLAALSQVAISMGVPSAERATADLLAVGERVYRKDSVDWIEARRLRAAALLAANRPADAAALLEPLRVQWLARPTPESLRALVVLEQATVAAGADEAVVVACTQALRKAAHAVAATDPDAALGALIAGVEAMSSMHRFRDALEQADEVLALWERMGRPARVDVLHLYGGIGNAASSLNEPARGEQAYRDALALADRLYTGPHAQKAWYEGVLGSFLVSQGRVAEAEAPVLHALQMRRELLGDTHPETLFAFNAAGRLRAAQGRNEEALAFVDQSVAACEQARLQDTACVAALYTRGRILSGLKRYPEAERDLQAAVAMQSALTGPQSALVAAPMTYLAELQRRAGRPQEARATAEAALAIEREAGGGHWAQQATLRFQHAWALFDLGDIPAALEEITAVEAEFSLRTPDNVKTRLGMLTLLARAQARDGQSAAARRTAQSALALMAERKLQDPEAERLLRALHDTGHE